MKTKLLILFIIIFLLLLTVYYWQSNQPEPRPTNESLTATEKLEHSDHNPALSDVNAATEETATSQTHPDEIKNNRVSTLSEKAKAQREKLTSELQSLLHCRANQTCPEDDSDPRAGSILLGKLIATALHDYLQLHLEQGYFDQASLDMVKNFVNYPDGHVQEEAINLMSQQQPDADTARALIDALKDSFDAKIIKQSMLELLRYPELTGEIQVLLQQSLVTGSFLVTQEIAANILPFLNTANIDSYISIANQLPVRSKRARYLNANIKEFQMRQSGG